VAALAARAATAPSAVIRLCRTLGFSGFSEFKIQLAMELAQDETLPYMPGIRPEDSSEEILKKVFDADIKSLRDTMKRLDCAAFDAVVDQICRAGTVYIYGLGTSAGIAGDLQYRLMSLGYSALAFSDISYMSVSTLNIRENDLVVGISHSGRTVAILDALTKAAEAGAETACITSYKGSPLARICKYVLSVYSDETRYPMEAVSSRIAQIAVVDAIAAALSARCYGESGLRSSAIHAAMDAIRYPEERR
jgi:DNA-binding MurR/RpiR family transcriptional regulator